MIFGRYWCPSPDIAVIRGPDTRYQARHPDASEVALLIEVSDSTYAVDRGPKWRRYAASRVPYYWIVNLPMRQIEVYREPAGRGRSASYRVVEVFASGSEIPVIIEGREAGRIAVDEILPQTIRP